MTTPSSEASALVDPAEKIPLGISSCLLGEPVRFDGGHKKNNYIVDSLGEYFSYRGFCPELAIGMGVPRPTIHLIEESPAPITEAEPSGSATESQIRVVGVKDASLDVTEALQDIAEQQRAWHDQIYGYIVKKDSPSCGMERVKVYLGKQGSGHVERRGRGRYTEVMMQNFPNLPVEEEGRLCDPALRENFVTRVFVYKRWRDLLAEEFSWSVLSRFHGQLKWTLFSHDQNEARQLGKDLAAKHKLDATELAQWYEGELMRILRIVATRKNHVNVLEHIRGYLKNHLDADEKQEIGESIEDYRLGLLPLIVPVTLLRHYFRRYPDPYILASCYLNPHPKQLMLLNQI